MGSGTNDTVDNTDGGDEGVLVVRGRRKGSVDVTDVSVKTVTVTNDEGGEEKDDSKDDVTLVLVSHDLGLSDDDVLGHAVVSITIINSWSINSLLLREVRGIILDRVEGLSCSGWTDTLESSGHCVMQEAMKLVGQSRP